MKKWMVVGALALGGCAQITSYDQAVKTPASAELQGNWQTLTAQSALISDQAVASLIITPQGDTLDCRQWQRVIAKPGKLSHLDGEDINITRQLRVMPLVRAGNVLHYDGLELQRVNHPTPECQQAMTALQAQPDTDVLQNIQPELLKPNPAQP